MDSFPESVRICDQGTMGEQLNGPRALGLALTATFISLAFIFWVFA